MTFGDHFAWQAQHFRRVVLRVFCKSHCQAYVMKIDGGLARNIDFEVVDFGAVYEKTRRKMLILKQQSVKI